MKTPILCPNNSSVAVENKVKVLHISNKEFLDILLYIYFFLNFYKYNIKKIIFLNNFCCFVRQPTDFDKFTKYSVIPYYNMLLQAERCSFY